MSDSEGFKLIVKGTFLQIVPDEPDSRRCFTAPAASTHEPEQEQDPEHREVQEERPEIPSTPVNDSAFQWPIDIDDRFKETPMRASADHSTSVTAAQLAKFPEDPDLDQAAGAAKAQSVENFLESISLSKYAKVFEENGLELLSDVIEVTDEELNGMGVLLGHRKRILKELRELLSPVLQPPAQPATESRTNVEPEQGWHHAPRNAPGTATHDTSCNAQRNAPTNMNRQAVPKARPVWHLVPDGVTIEYNAGGLVTRVTGGKMDEVTEGKTVLNKVNNVEVTKYGSVTGSCRRRQTVVLEVPTTKVLKNCPKELETPKELLAALQQCGPPLNLAKAVDFGYEPRDFKKGNKLGFAFFHFRSEDLADRFHEHFDGLALADRRLSVYTGVKTKEHMINDMQHHPVMKKPAHWHPQIFDVNGKPEAFPAPTAGAVRPPGNFHRG